VFILVVESNSFGSQAIEEGYFLESQ